MQKGEGRDVLLLHGYMSCKESFYFTAECLKKQYRITAPDFPGFGASSPLIEAWSVGDYAVWLEKFIKSSGLSRPYILAHSFGARVAIKLAAAHPQLISGLIITGGAGIVKKRTRAYKARVRAYKIVKRFAPKFAEKHFGSSEYRSLSPLMRESYKKIVNEDLSAEAAKVSLPVQLIYGSDDTVTPACEEGLAFASLFKNSRLEIMEGGHFCFSQNHAIFNSKVIAFLTEGEREQKWEYSYP